MTSCGSRAARPEVRDRPTADPRGGDASEPASPAPPPGDQAGRRLDDLYAGHAPASDRRPARDPATGWGPRDAECGVLAWHTSKEAAFRWTSPSCSSSPWWS